jgi:hypothetical protein
MPNAGVILRAFYDAVVKRDIAAARPAFDGRPFAVMFAGGKRD